MAWLNHLQPNGDSPHLQPQAKPSKPIEQYANQSVHMFCSIARCLGQLPWDTCFNYCDAHRCPTGFFRPKWRATLNSSTSYSFLSMFASQIGLSPSICSSFSTGSGAHVAAQPTKQCCLDAGLLAFLYLSLSACFLSNLAALEVADFAVLSSNLGSTGRRPNLEIGRRIYGSGSWRSD